MNQEKKTYKGVIINTAKKQRITFPKAVAEYIPTKLCNVTALRGSTALACINPLPPDYRIGTTLDKVQRRKFQRPSTLTHYIDLHSITAPMLLHILRADPEKERTPIFLTLTMDGAGQPQIDITI